MISWRCALIALSMNHHAPSRLQESASKSLSFKGMASLTSSFRKRPQWILQVTSDTWTVLFAGISCKRQPYPAEISIGTIQGRRAEASPQTSGFEAVHEASSERTCFQASAHEANYILASRLLQKSFHTSQGWGSLRLKILGWMQPFWGLESGGCSSLIHCPMILRHLTKPYRAKTF